MLYFLLHTPVGSVADNNAAQAVGRDFTENAGHCQGPHRHNATVFLEIKASTEVRSKFAVSLLLL